MEHTDAFDLSIIFFMKQHLTRGLIRLMIAITFFGSSGFLFPAYVVLAGYFFIAKKFYDAIDIAIVSLSSTGMSHALKGLFHRHRPQLPVISNITTYSFPSGHALSSFVFCSVVMYMIWHTKINTAWKYLLAAWLALCTLAIGASRVVLNVHYATDVIAGFCLGIIWVILCFYVIKKLRENKYYLV